MSLSQILQLYKSTSPAGAMCTSLSHTLPSHTHCTIWRTVQNNILCLVVSPSMLCHSLAVTSGCTTRVRTHSCIRVESITRGDYYPSTSTSTSGSITRVRVLLESRIPLEYEYVGECYSSNLWEYSSTSMSTGSFTRVRVLVGECYSSKSRLLVGVLEYEYEYSITRVRVLVKNITRLRVWVYIFLTRVRVLGVLLESEYQWRILHEYEYTVFFNSSTSTGGL